MENVDGKTVVITGGASGIGLALAHAFGRRGANVVLGDVEESELDRAVGALKEAGIAVAGAVADVADASSVDALADEAERTFGAVHVVCNNAGVGPGGVTWEIPPEVWRWVLDVNLWGVINGIRTFVPRLVSQGEGHVVNTASVAGLLASPGMAPYAASKHAVVGVSEALQRDLELEGSNVGVTVVCPSMTRTRMNDSGRNWPARLGPPPATGLAPGHPTTRAGFVERMSSAAVDPEIVAERTVAAVLAKEFWVVFGDLESRYRDQANAILASLGTTAGG